MAPPERSWPLATFGNSHISGSDGVDSRVGTATTGSLIAVARDSVLTGVAPDPLLVDSSGLKLGRLLDLLPRMEVREGLLKIKSQEDFETK